MSQSSARRSRRKHQGHPGRLTRARKAELAKLEPNDPETQQLNRMMREAIKAAPPEDGRVVGPMVVAARHAAQQLVKAYGLEDAHEEEHLAAIEYWLVGQFGECVHRFDLESYFGWRQECLDRAAATLEDS